MDESFYHISEKAVERVAEMAALTVPGVHHLDAQLAGLAGRKYPRVDVRLDMASAIAAVEAEIATTYPAPVAAITDAVRATIIAHVRALCGLDVSRVKVTVAHVENDPQQGRVTWDDVASHTAEPETDAIRVSPSRVTSPVTKEREELTPIEVAASWEDMREVTLPAPPEVEHIEVPTEPNVEHIEAPEPSYVQASGFVGAPRELEEVSVPPEREVRVPMPTRPQELAAIRVHATNVRGVNVPEPRQLMPARALPMTALSPVYVEHPTRVEPVSLPLRKPLKQVLVERPPMVPVSIPPAPKLRHVAPPAPQRVLRPVAPAPQPLKQITIRPVEKYYDRTR